MSIPTGAADALRDVYCIYICINVRNPTKVFSIFYRQLHIYYDKDKSNNHRFISELKIIIQKRNTKREIV